MTDQILLMLDNSKITLDALMGIVETHKAQERPLVERIRDYIECHARKDLDRIQGRELSSSLVLRRTMEPDDQKAYWDEVTKHYVEKYRELTR